MMHVHEKHPDGNSHVIVQVAFRLYHYSQIFTITVQVTVDICRHIFRALDEAHTLKIFFFYNVNCTPDGSYGKQINLYYSFQFGFTFYFFFFQPIKMQSILVFHYGLYTRY